MNTYEITFTRENGSTGKDRITAANEKQARKDFREIYRHSSATITDVIVAAENVPASKQQERDALDQIRAIVDTLGPDSYLATAFAGCFEDAEENIKNDFACSMKQRLESAEAKRIEAELGYNRLVDKLAASEKALEAARADIEKKDEEIAALNARISAIQRPTEPAEISDELLADLATFSSVYIERIQKAIIENAGQIAKNATLVRLLHQYSTRLEQERIEYAREVYNCAKHGTEFQPSNKCLTHANSYRDVIQDLLHGYWSYEDKDGNRRKAVEITVDSVHFCDSKKDGGQSSGSDFADPGYPSNSVTLVTNQIIKMLCFDATEPSTVIYNQAPTAPSSITVPSEVLGGENLSISWAASTDPDGNLSGYVLERKVGSGTWAQIYKGSSRSYTDAITYGWTSVQYRVKAYDAAGAESAYTTSATRTVTNNRPPVISGTDGALGSFSTAAPSYEYTVTDADGHQVDVVEMLDGVTLRSYTVTLGHTNTLTIGSEAWLKVVNGSHTLKIVATDAKDASVTRTLTFTKAVTSVEFEQTLAMEADAMPTKALVNIQGNFPAGCTLQVWICNNGNDASPTWEDITQKVRTGQKHYFTNKTKTAAAWGVKVKAKLLRGSATETCYIQSIGGNFA